MLDSQYEIENSLMASEPNLPTNDDLNWCAGALDVSGAIGVARNSNGPHLYVRFRTPYRDRLVQIQNAVGGIGHLKDAPNPPSGNSVQPHHELTFRGKDYFMLESMLLQHMRTNKRDQFWTKREELAELRKNLGLVSPFPLATKEELIEADEERPTSK